jgi:hypothetical protein
VPRHKVSKRRHSCDEGGKNLGKETNLHENAIFFIGPAFALDGRIELVVPSLAALFAIASR